MSIRRPPPHANTHINMYIQTCIHTCIKCNLAVRKCTFICPFKCFKAHLFKCLNVKEAQGGLIHTQTHAFSCIQHINTHKHAYTHMHSGGICKQTHKHIRTCILNCNLQKYQVSGHLFNCLKHKDTSCMHKHISKPHTCIHTHAYKQAKKLLGQFFAYVSCCHGDATLRASESA